LYYNLYSQHFRNHGIVGSIDENIILFSDLAF